MAEGLSVREVEALASAEVPEGDTPRPGRPRKPERDGQVRSLEQAMARALGVTVSLKSKTQGSGEIRIRYETPEELDALCRRFEISNGA